MVRAARSYRIYARKWKFQATIEFEYPVPDGSDRMRELAKAIAYCKSSLV